jgi:hypothetical protein
MEGQKTIYTRLEIISFLFQNLSNVSITFWVIFVIFETNKENNANIKWILKQK